MARFAVFCDFKTVPREDNGLKGFGSCFEAEGFVEPLQDLRIKPARGNDAQLLGPLVEGVGKANRRCLGARRVTHQRHRSK
jgi:hypothetical protein